MIAVRRGTALRSVKAERAGILAWLQACMQKLQSTTATMSPLTLVAWQLLLAAFSPQPLPFYIFLPWTLVVLPTADGCEPSPSAGQLSWALAPK